MKIPKQKVFTLSVVGLLLSALAAPAAVVHRYSFNEPAGATTVADSVGAANGVVAGNGAAFDGSGQLMLPGGSTSTATPDIISGYVDLPNHMINSLSSVTIEAWVTLSAYNTWQRIMDFGVSGDGLENSSSGGGGYLFICLPSADGTARFAVRDPAAGAEFTVCNSSSSLPGGEICLTATYDPANNVARFYVNGALVATDDAPLALSAINDINNWLGRSQWPDAMFSGTFNEFRIYNTAMDPVSAAASFFNGVTNVSTSVTALGEIQTVALVVPITTLTVQDTEATTATADFANITGVSLAGAAGVTYQSSNPGVLTVSTNGLITAVGAGNANVTVNYMTKSASVAVTVNPRLQGVVVAGALEVDLRATDLSSSTATWTNRAAASSIFTAEGAPVYNPNVANGLAGVTFVGNSNAYVGSPVSAEISGNSEFSVEAWAFVPSLKAENTLVAWGYRSPGADAVLGTGNHPVYGAASFFGGGYDLGWNGPAPVQGAWHYYAMTYNGNRLTKVYLDGSLRSSLTVPANLQIPPSLPVRVAAQNSGAADGTPDFGQALSGSVALVRVHTGLLSDNDVANNFLYGVEMTAPGALQSVQLTFAKTNLPGKRFKTLASVRPNYANRNYLVANRFSTFSSSDTNVATVDVNGYVTAVNNGTAKIIASYGGLSVTNTITVDAPPATTLTHRWSFNETSGTVVADSVGGANGQIKGNGATLGAGQITLPGGTGSAADPATIAGYVDLPNYLISPLVNVSYSVWATWQGAGDWQRIFDFGTSNGGEDISNGEGSYMFVNTQPWRFAVRDIPANGEPVVMNVGGGMPTGSEFNITVSYNFTENVSRLYTNGVLAATASAAVQLSTINDVNNWLGRSQWNDSVFQGSISEVRIYEGALSPTQVAAVYTAGADTLPVLLPPSLTVLRSGGNVIVSWPTNNSSGAVLQSAGALTGATWTNVPGTTVSGTSYQVTVPVVGSQQYFKLVK